VTIAMDWPFNFMSGLDYSLKVYEKTGESENLLKSRPFMIAVLSSLPITATVGWIYTKTPDWMLSYCADHRKVPRAMQALFFLLYPVMYTSGYVLAPQLEQVRRGLTRKVIAVIMAYEGLFAVLGWKRLSHICTTEEFESGESSLAVWHPNHVRWMLVGAMLAAQAVLLKEELENLG
jgi:hypothetical protein